MFPFLSCMSFSYYVKKETWKNKVRHGKKETAASWFQWWKWRVMCYEISWLMIWQMLSPACEFVRMSKKTLSVPFERAEITQPAYRRPKLQCHGCSVVCALLNKWPDKLWRAGSPVPESAKTPKDESSDCKTASTKRNWLQFYSRFLRKIWQHGTGDHRKLKPPPYQSSHKTLTSKNQFNIKHKSPNLLVWLKQKFAPTEKEREKREFPKSSLQPNMRKGRESKEKPKLSSPTSSYI